MKRTPTRAEGGITAEEKLRMDAISKKWVDIAFKTGSTNKQKLIEILNWWAISV